MEVEKISPVAPSPLDACRGRGKHLYLPRIRTARPRPSPKASASGELPSIVM
jgi:hypothetical protein